MSKAQDLAKELYPDWEMTGVPRVDGQEESMIRIQRVAYVKGYHQAEKDLELTWKDVQNIRNIIAEMMVESYTRNDSWSTHEEFSKEVLKRFKDLKK